MEEKTLKENDRTSVMLSKGDDLYLFMQAGIAGDGSLEIWFPDIKENTGKTQTIEIQQNNSITTSSVIETHDSSSDDNTYYISYHSSGLVRYHKMSFDNAYMEPLYEIKEPNPFFIYSFVHPQKAFKNTTKKQYTNQVTIDISGAENKRLDFVLSICPQNFKIKHSNMILLKFPLYCLCIEFLDDNESLNLIQCYKAEESVKLRPRLDKYGCQKVTRPQAFLKYKQTLFETKEAIVLPPNGEGILEIIFAVEMRIPPWIRVAFKNQNYSIEVTKKTTVNLKFKVFDCKLNQYIKDPQKIEITELILDAEIYEENDVVPPGYM